jgi:hypothetical protein
MWLTRQHGVALGRAVSGWQTEANGAESVVGLLINTVPMRARITRSTSYRVTGHGQPGMRVEFDTAAGGAAKIEGLIEPLQRMFVAMIAEPERRS